MYRSFIYTPHPTDLRRMTILVFLHAWNILLDLVVGFVVYWYWTIQYFHSLQLTCYKHDHTIQLVCYKVNREYSIIAVFCALHKTKGWELWKVYNLN